MQSGPNQPQGGFDPFVQQQPMQGQWPQQTGMPPQPNMPNGQWMQSGQPIPGYELDKSPVLTGNWIEKKVRWAEDKSAGSLAGQEVILRFVMKDADLYALRFGAEK